MVGSLCFLVGTMIESYKVTFGMGLYFFPPLKLANSWVRNAMQIIVGFEQG